MKSSFASVVITPPVGVPLAGNGREDARSRGVHDDLRANFAYMESGDQRYLLISLDLLGLKRRETDAIKERIAEKTDIPREYITVICSHTHSGPNTVEIFKLFLTQEDIEACNAYCAWLVNTVAEAVPGLVRAAAESRIGFGRQMVEGFSFNRRAVLKDGTLRMVFEEFDRDEIDRLAGPNGDPEMHVFVLTQGENGRRLKGLIVQYTSHPAVVCGADWLYSRDYVDALTNVLQETYGPDVVVLYANGAQGNQVAADPYRPFVTGFPEAERVGRALAAGAVEAVDRVLTAGMLYREVPICVLEAPLTLPIRKIPPEDVVRAEELMRAYPAGGGACLHGLDPRVEAESILEMARRPEKEETTLLQAIRLGEAWIVTFPGEVFLEHAQKVFEMLPDKHTVVFGLANDYVGYIPTREAFGEGGYEVKTSYASSRFDPCAGELLVNACRELLGRHCAQDI